MGADLLAEHVGVGIVAAEAPTQGSYKVYYRRNVSSSVTSGTKTDATFVNHARPPIITIDFTISCIFNPSYIGAAAVDPRAIFDLRAAEKYEKHLQGCDDMGRYFLAFVITTLGGVGPPDVWRWFDSIYREAFMLARAAGEDGSDVLQRREHAIARLAASLMRTRTDMLVELATPPDHGPDAHPPPPRRPLPLSPPPLEAR